MNGHMLRRALLAGAMLAGFCGGAQADEKAYGACMGKAESTYDSVTCQKAELAIVEAQLNTAYTAAMAALPPDQQAKLKAAERQWIAFRSSDCAAFYGEHTGTYASIQGGTCMINRARSRIRDLAEFVEP